jgi:CHAD domain-containing protein
MGAAISGGDYAAAILEQQLRHVVDLQADVLADRDPEPLHQLRVRFRRLRSSLRQFAPALILPESADDQRIAKIGRRLGMARDLDVLRDRLDQQLLPKLPEPELLALKKLLKQLKRERKLAFEELHITLHSRRYLRLLADLQTWLKQPGFTPLGQEPLLDWLPQWKLAVLADLLPHPGWRVSDPHAASALEAVHQLRKRLKTARYGLANLKEVEGEAVAVWASRFKAMQERLGDLNDLQVLHTAISHQLDGEMEALVPTLCWHLLEARNQAWRQWLELSAELRTPEGRQSLYALVLQPPAAAGAAVKQAQHG